MTVKDDTVDGTLITNVAEVERVDQKDLVTGNNRVEETTLVEVEVVGLSVTKSDSVDPVIAGRGLVYTVEVSNTSDVNATNVLIRDTLPERVSLREVGAPKGTSYDRDLGLWKIPLLVGRGKLRLTLAVTVKDDTLDGTVITNVAELVGVDQKEVVPGNNTAIETTLVEVEAVDLSVTKSDSVDPVLAGRGLVYAVVVTNNSDVNATNVVIRDTLPGGVVLKDVGAPRQTDFDEATGLWSIPLIVSKGTVRLTLAVEVVEGTPDGTVITNVAELVRLDQLDPVAGNNRAEEDTTVAVPTVDLSIAKADSVDPVLAGRGLVYTVVVTNNSDVNATNVVIRDTLPGGVVLKDVGAPRQTDFDEATGLWSIPLIVSKGTVRLTLAVEVVEGTPDGTVITNVAELVRLDQLDPVAGNNRAEEDTTVAVPTVDLSITKADSVDPVLAGRGLVYTVVVTNNSDVNATNVVIRDTLPGGVVLKDVGAPRRTDFDEATGLWSIPLIVSKGTVRLTLAVEVVEGTPDGTVITNVAELVRLDQLDPVAGNNRAEETTTVQVERVDLSVTKTDSLDPVTAGKVLVYKLEVKNNSNVDATSVVIRDTLPLQVSLRNALTPRGVSFDEATGELRIPRLRGGRSAKMTLVVEVLEGTPDGTVMTNVLEVVSLDQVDPVAGNNRVEETTTVEVETVDLKVTKVDNRDPVDIGDQLVYVITVSNESDRIATGVRAVEALSPNVTLVSATAFTGRYRAATSVWDIGVLEPDQQAFLFLRVRVEGGPVENTVSVTSDQADANAADNTVTEPTEIGTAGSQSSAPVSPSSPGATSSHSVDLEVTKEDNVDPVAAGGQLGYLITVTNNSTSTATGVVATESLPAEVAFDSATPFVGAFDAATGVWTIGSLAPGASATLAISVTVSSTATSTLTNTVSVAGDQAETDPSDNTATETTGVTLPKVDLDISKSADQETVIAGDQLTYTVTVTNTATTTATGVEVAEGAAGAGFARFGGARSG